MLLSPFIKKLGYAAAASLSPVLLEVAFEVILTAGLRLNSWVKSKAENQERALLRLRDGLPTTTSSSSTKITRSPSLS